MLIRLKVANTEEDQMNRLNFCTSPIIPRTRGITRIRFGNPQIELREAVVANAVVWIVL